MKTTISGYRVTGLSGYVGIGNRAIGQSDYRAMCQSPASRVTEHACDHPHLVGPGRRLGGCWRWSFARLVRLDD